MKIINMNNWNVIMNREEKIKEEKTEKGNKRIYDRKMKEVPVENKEESDKCKKKVKKQ